MRHGETETNRRHIWQCSMDEPLNNNGRNQALEAAAVVKILKPDIIISSDLKRAKETAQIVSSFLEGVEIEIEPGIRERGCGKAEGLTAEEILQAFGFRMEMTSSHLDSVPGAEPYTRFAERVVNSFNHLYDKYVGARILAGCHGGVMRTFYNEQIRPIPSGIVFRNCSIISTEKSNGAWSIVDRYNTENI